MDFRKLDLNLCKVVVAISDKGSISMAADYLNVTQPAVSNSLKRLRLLTGDRIFVRTPYGQKPTTLGQSLVRASKWIISELESCLQHPSEFDPESNPHTFRIAVHGLLEGLLMPSILARMQRYPRLDFRLFELDKAASVAAMEAGDIDLMLGPEIQLEESAGLLQETLFEDELCVAVRKGHPIASKKQLTRDDFLNLKFVIMRPNMDDNIQFAEMVLAKLGMQIQIAVVTSAVMTAPAVVARTDYAATLYSKLYAPVIPSFKLVTYPMPFAFPPIQIVMKRLRRFENNPSLLWLANEIRSVIREKNVRDPFVS